MGLSLCVLLLLFISLFFYSAPCITAGRNSDTSHSLVQSSCIHASYPNLCIRTLSSYAGPAKTPNDVAQAAVSVSLSCAQKMSQYLTDLEKPRSGREPGALKDCVEQLSESVDELHKTLSELQHLTRSSFRWQMSNAETWVSAALTNEDTCLDGFKDVDGKIKVDVRKRITNVAKVTSNALYLITRLGDSRGNP